MKRGTLWLRPAAAVILLLLIMLVMPATAYGSEAAVSLSCDDMAAAGSAFSAALEYRGTTFGAASVEVTYDPAVLEFKSCSSGEGAVSEDGLARIFLDGGDGREYLSCKIRFQAVSEGESFITVTTSSVENVDGIVMTAQTQSVKVTVVSEEDFVLLASADTSDNESSEEGSQEDVAGKASDDGKSSDEDTPGGLLGLADWVKSGISEGIFAEEAGENCRMFLNGLSVTEFLVLSLCVTVILLLLILLAAEKRKGKGRR